MSVDKVNHKDNHYSPGLDRMPQLN